MVRPGLSSPCARICSPRSGGDGPTPTKPPFPSSQFSPLRRGWSEQILDKCPVQIVLPAQAGMVRLIRCVRASSSCSPRSGGDGPRGTHHPEEGARFSPLRRGWSGAGHAGQARRTVLPAQAGMVPPGFRSDTLPLCSPRSGGDGPVLFVFRTAASKFSPLRRGWSQPCGASSMCQRVLPAQAGMVRRSTRSLASLVCSPRSGGDGPPFSAPSRFRAWFSPLRRGWSFPHRRSQPPNIVLPAQAGMVPRSVLYTPAWAGSPRSGGDGPSSIFGSSASTSFSPLRRGWSKVAASR